MHNALYCGMSQTHDPLAPGYVHNPPQPALPTDPKARKDIPLARGLLDYFPDALCAVAQLSLKGNDQHNPGQALHWAKEKSTDEADALMRHLIERGKLDKDGVKHSTKVAWRALALLQREIDAEHEKAFVLRTMGEMHSAVRTMDDLRRAYNSDLPHDLCAR